jgi:hypothetical protein
MEGTAVAGTVIGGIAGAATGSIVPGVGTIVGSGLLAAALGAAMGATGGLWVGALTDIGVPESDAKYYESAFKQGRTLVVARTDGRAAEAERVFRAHGALETDRSGGLNQAA